MLQANLYGYKKTTCIKETTKLQHNIIRHNPLNMSLTQPTFSKDNLQSLYTSAPTSMFGTKWIKLFNGDCI